MTADKIKAIVLDALEDMKGEDIIVLDVANKTSVTDIIIIATGSSSRHVKSLASNVVTEAKHADVMPLGVEGEDDAEWVLVDLGDVVVHVMQRQIREFYDIESLWKMDLNSQKNAS